MSTRKANAAAKKLQWAMERSLSFAYLLPVVALPVVVMVLVKKLTRVIQLFLVAGVTG